MYPVVRFIFYVKKWQKALVFPLHTTMFTVVLMFFLSSLFLHHVDSNCKRMWQRFPLKDLVLVITWIQEERMDDRRTNFLHGFGTSLDSFGSKDFLPRWMEKGPKCVNVIQVSFGLNFYWIASLDQKEGMTG